MKKKYLVLADGSVFEGVSVGADRESVGELVFTTGMCSYLETITDPSYYGQIVLFTFPMIGNYGVIPGDFEGKPALSGVVMREICDGPSNFRSAGPLSDYLITHDIPAIAGIDTRAVTRRLREFGVLGAGLLNAPPSDLSAIRAFSIRGAVDAVTSGATSFVPADGEEKYRVALLDYGAKHNIVRSLTARGCSVTILPAETAAGDILGRYDGVMLSNGPGDPAENVAEIETIRALLGRVPIFGICLGHQLLALAAGAVTEKMKYGHRGGNQPVREANGGHTYITSQNHGYAVVGDSVIRGRVRFTNANDGSVEGIDYPEDGALSAQFHPEARGGPRDTDFLFDEFCDLMEERRHAAG